jgi:hypothetical protein
MAVLIDDTVGGEYSNSFADLTFLDEYFSDHFDTAKQATWDALSDGQKQTLAVQATILIDQLKFTYSQERSQLFLHYDRRTGTVHDFAATYAPVRYTWNQALQFPRNLDVDSVTGTPYIPENVKIAQAEMAVALKDYSDIDLTSILSGIKREAIELPGPMRQDITYQDGGSMSSFSSVSNISPLAVNYLSKYLVYGESLKRA